MLLPINKSRLTTIVSLLLEYLKILVRLGLPLFMALVILFAAAGLAVARDNPDYHGYIWVSVLLLAMSVTIIAATVIRLIKRYTQKPVR